MEKKRHVSLDVYRLLCMFLITTIHIFGYSGVLAHIPHTNVNFYLVSVIDALQHFAINGFVMLSAYFLVNKKETLSRIVRFEIQLIFYSVVIFAIAAPLIGVPTGSSVLSGLVYSVFPLLTNHYWYAVCYMILLLLIPLFNKMIAALTQGEHLALIVVLGIVCSTLFHIDPFFSSTDFIGHYSHSLLWFFTLYFITAYIKLYPIKHPTFWGPVLFGLSTLTLTVLVAVKHNVFGITTAFPSLHGLLLGVDLLSNNSLPALLLSVSSFVTFSQRKPRPATRISAAFGALVPSFFAIYLIQEHAMVRSTLWSFVDIRQWATSPWLILVVVAVFAGLMAAAALLYAVYYLLNKWFLDKLATAICRKLDTLIQKCKP
jgi:hypothetical protein